MYRGRKALAARGGMGHFRASSSEHGITRIGVFGCRSVLACGSIWHVCFLVSMVRESSEWECLGVLSCVDLIAGSAL